jgi:uncharacterized membrane protein
MKIIALYFEKKSFLMIFKSMELKVFTKNTSFYGPS